ncbi:MAG: outer membrane protein [Amphiplicatus sp.]
MRFLFLAIAAAAVATPASAEVALGVYLGWNDSLKSDVGVTGPGGTDFTIADTPWKGLSLPGDDGAPYYGFRGTYWFNEGASLGLMLDYTHMKVQAEPGAIVALSGDTGASLVAPGAYPVSALFNRLELTHGVTAITANALYRTAPMGRFAPYAGAGLGVTIPHIEVDGSALTDLPYTYQYGFGGATAQGFIGADFRLSRRVSLFGEYKLNYSRVRADLSDETYRVKTNLLTNQLLFGVAVHFGRK